MKTQERATTHAVSAYWSRSGLLFLDRTEVLDLFPATAKVDLYDAVRGANTLQLANCEEYLTLLLYVLSKKPPPLSNFGGHSHQMTT